MRALRPLVAIVNVALALTARYCRANRGTLHEGTDYSQAAGLTALVLAAAVAYLCLWPIPAEPVSWSAQKPPGYMGAFAPNTGLSGLRIIDTGSELGPEHIAIGPDGKLYAAMHSGNLIRMEQDGSKQEVFCKYGRARTGLRLRCAGTHDCRGRHEGAACHHPRPARHRAHRSRGPQ
jgi:hypothetical protein